jgi:3D (Asp-Asp-Asp) domain-containing protein
MRRGILLLAGLAALLTNVACASAGERVLEVTASAYNAVPEQTDGDPNIAAWGDRLKPGVRAIAVSRDLLKMGMTRGTRVRIDGLPGEYRVMDKMAKRWRKKIDIFMGNDVEGARKWGVRTVTIRWIPKPK